MLQLVEYLDISKVKDRKWRQHYKVCKSTVRDLKYTRLSFCREYLFDLLNCASLTRGGLCSMNDASGFGSVKFMYYSFRFQFSPYAAACSCLNFCCLDSNRRRLVSLFERYYLLMLTILSCD
jgi:hypothetical protein